MTALVLAIAKGFGAAKALEDWIKGQTFTNPEVVEWMMNIANKALENTQGGIDHRVGNRVIAMVCDPDVRKYGAGDEPDMGGEKRT